MPRKCGASSTIPKAFNFRFQIGPVPTRRSMVTATVRTYENLNKFWAQRPLHHERGLALRRASRTSRGSLAPPGRHRQGALNVELMPTMVGVWENYKLYLSRGISLSHGIAICRATSPSTTTNWSMTSGAPPPPDVVTDAPYSATSVPTHSTITSDGQTYRILPPRPCLPCRDEKR